MCVVVIIITINTIIVTMYLIPRLFCMLTAVVNWEDGAFYTEDEREILSKRKNKKMCFDFDA